MTPSHAVPSTDGWYWMWNSESRDWEAVWFLIGHGFVRAGYDEPFYARELPPNPVWLPLTPPKDPT